MVPEKYRLDAVGRFLVEAYERQRPGLTEWTPELEFELLKDSEAELSRMQIQCSELGTDDPAYWKRVRETLRTVILPRYAVLAKEELKLAKAGYHLWRNGDLIARAAFAGAGLLLGAAAVAIPWIPVTEKLVPLLLFVAGPLIPDAQLWFYRKRYQRRLEALFRDLKQAGKSWETYQSLAEMQRALGEQGLPVSPPAPSEIEGAQARPPRIKD
jgi:hypothetical protein